MRFLGRFLACGTALLVMWGQATAAPAQRPTASIPSSAVPTGLLPTTAEPLDYTLHFTLDPASKRFGGKATLQVRLLAASDHVWLHGRGLDMRAVTVIPAGGPALPARYKQVNGDGVARVDFGRQLKAQDITLTFDYSANFSGDLEGIYKISRGMDNYLMTQMESIGARRAFPGFDEPRFKTPFRLSLSFPAQHKAYANTQQLTEQVSGMTKTLTFGVTEKLPTYLVAFAVGPWEVTDTSSVPPSSVRKNPIPLRVIGPRGTAGKLGYALANTPKLVIGLEEYFGTPYPFDKLDLLAGPDFAFGAMENAGLITFVDSLLVIDEKSSVGAINAFRSVNTHELAHQWFGNLVTPYWWDDIWLNEAFATWNAAKITTRLFPTESFALRQLRSTQGAMNEDSLISARQIREPVNNTGDIAAAFDSITYQKGAGVLSTFENWIGEDAFQRGVQAHMAKHARAAATADDLIGALATASGKGDSFARALRTFLDQPGLPLVAVTAQCTPNGPASLSLKQSRYLPLGSPGENSAARNALWQVPVCVRLGSATGGPSTQRCELLDAREKTMSLDQCPAWVMPNANAGGYYRFTLPPNQQQALLAALPLLSPPEQLAVLDAASASFALGTTDLNALLEAAAAAASSPHIEVVGKLWERFRFADMHVLDAAGRQALRARLAQIYQPLYARLGVTPQAGEPAQNTELRARLLDFLAVDYEVPAVRDALLAASQRGFDTPGERMTLTGVSEDLLAPALTVWARSSGPAGAERLMKERLLNQDPAQRLAVITALASLKDPVIAASVRDLALRSDMQKRDIAAVMQTQARHRVLEGSFWSWYQTNFSALLKRLPAMSQSQLVEAGTRGRCTTPDIAPFQQFIGGKVNTIANGPRALKQAVEEMTICAAIAKHHAPTTLVLAP